MGVSFEESIKPRDIATGAFRLCWKLPTNTMKEFVFLIIICTAFTSPQASVSPELKAKMRSYVAECNQIPQIEQSVIDLYIKLDGLPSTRDEKCFVACVLNKFEVIKNHKFVSEKQDEFNKMKFVKEDWGKVEMVSKICKEKIPTELNDDCEMSLLIMACYIDEFKKANLTSPNFD